MTAPIASMMRSPAPRALLSPPSDSAKRADIGLRANSPVMERKGALGWRYALGPERKATRMTRMARIEPLSARFDSRHSRHSRCCCLSLLLGLDPHRVEASPH